MKVDTLPKNQLKKSVPDMRTGQVVRVHERIQEGNKERIQVFEGLVIAVKHGKGLDGTFTVRKIGAGGIGVERIFPIHMPAIEKIEVLRQEKVRRSKLYFVRGQVGKKTKKRKTKLQSVIYDMAGTDEAEEPGDAEDVAEEQTTDSEQESTEAEEAKTEEGDTNEESAEETPKVEDEDTNTEEEKPSEESEAGDSGEEKKEEEGANEDEQKTDEEAGEKEDVEKTEKTEEPEDTKEGAEEPEDQEEEKKDAEEK